ncbi:ABC-type multidrug transport system, ATPase component [Anaerovibrio sp. JC8]|uniref:ABC transporter ATP-binding protein n=1 Tax=Anaerovibrio sp. JC8 TaxID=1240085 RepID=UPI000A0BA1C1|nr:ABC transporter ATP-binding protein [Anaerovibrio sp. JC8]ORU00436.1 ABC-type multidrug transport system, ATPase component [Anaerovibrio sp. JC8]
MIKIQGLIKEFQVKNKDKKVVTKRAVDNLSLQVKPGEIFGILGPNGAGKTTTIRMLTMETQPTLGEIYYNGESIKKNPREIKKLIGVVPQHINFDNDLTVGENMELHARLHHMSSEKRRQRIQEMLDFVELGDTINRMPRSLSGGMKRRLLIARSLIHEPKILFMDEPTVALDPQVRRRIWELIRALAANGTTVIITTHYIEEAEALCNRVAIVNKGKLIAIDTPEAFCNSLGRITVEWDDQTGHQYQFFESRQEAAVFAGTLEHGAHIRRTNLEDAFIELTGRKEGV